MILAPITFRRDDFAFDRPTAIREMAAAKAVLEKALSDLDLIAAPEERTHSRNIGFSFPPLRGRDLLNAMAIEEARAA